MGTPPEGKPPDPIPGFHIGMRWAIAAVFPGIPHLYFSAIQFKPFGSITLCRKNSEDKFLQPATFLNAKGAQAVLNVIVAAKKLAPLFEWKLVPYEVDYEGH